MENTSSGGKKIKVIRGYNMRLNEQALKFRAFFLGVINGAETEL
jgi:hypothetical protein